MTGIHIAVALMCKSSECMCIINRYDLIETPRKKYICWPFYLHFGRMKRLFIRIFSTKKIMRVRVIGSVCVFVFVFVCVVYAQSSSLFSQCNL